MSHQFEEGLILELARAGGREPVPAGPSGEFLIRCPESERHRDGDAHPSCRLNPEKNTFYCDVCAVGGGVKKLAELLGVQVPSGDNEKGRRPPNKKKAKLPLIFEATGPISAAAQDHFSSTLAKKYSQETWQAFGVLEGRVYPKGHPDRGEPAIGFALPSGGHHVYRYSRQDKRQRWCFANGGKSDLITVGLDRPDPVILAEGEWDAMCAYELGYPVATGTGAGSFQPAWSQRLAPREIAVVYDVDPAGKAGTDRAIESLNPTCRAWSVILPLSGDPDGDGKDLSDYVAVHGADAFRKLLEESCPPRLKATRGCVSDGASFTAAELIAAMEEAFPGTGGALRAGLAVHAYLSLDGASRPCALFYMGPPSSGKSLVDRMFLPTSECADLADFVYRCDDFTPASFVSRAANVAKKKLEEIDLLPKLAGKVLNTKELAPIFRGKDDDLTRAFAILTSVLDGDGYVAAGGSVGTRGYDRRIFFCWLGATTPFTNKTWKTMAALGPRILFYNTDAPEPSLEQLVQCQQEGSSSAEAAMQLRVNAFLLNFFKKHPPESVPESQIACSEAICKRIALNARLIARLRAGLSLQESEEGSKGAARYGPPEKEQEYRLVMTLNRLAKASALVMGRTEVDATDLALIDHIALSSAPELRRKVTVALIGLTRDAMLREDIRPIQVSIAKIAERVGASLPTVRHYAEELHVLRVAHFYPVPMGDPAGSTLELHEDFQELLEESHTQPLDAFNLSAEP